MAVFPSRTISLRNGKILTIRNPLPEDAQSLVDYINEVAAESENLSFGAGDAPFTKEQEIQYITSLQTDPHKIMAMGQIEGEMIAVSDISCHSLPRLRHSGDLGLSVKKKCWNMGVGKAILEYLIDWAKSDAHLKKINLQVKESNDSAIHLYKKFGFVEEGRLSRGMYINGKYFDLICMGIEL